MKSYINRLTIYAEIIHRSLRMKGYYQSGANQSDKLMDVGIHLIYVPIRAAINTLKIFTRQKKEKGLVKRLNPPSKF